MEDSPFSSPCLQPSCINGKNGGFEWFGCVQMLVKEKPIMLILQTEDKLGSMLRVKPVNFAEQRCNSLQDELAI